jgi:hypothetical protein
MIRKSILAGVVALVASTGMSSGTAHAAPTPGKAECQAAGHILLRKVSGKKIFEDYTWPGSPKIVNDQNDPIMRDGGLGPVLSACAQ